MKITLLNGVLLAEDFARLRDWWISVVGLEVLEEWTDTYHYAELGQDGRIVVGIADAEEMDTKPPSPRTNAVVVQLHVEDVKAFLGGIAGKGAKVLFGPSFEEGEGFWYGGFEDGEGNVVWVVGPAPA